MGGALAISQSDFRDWEIVASTQVISNVTSIGVWIFVYHYTGYKYLFESSNIDLQFVLNGCPWFCRTSCTTTCSKLVQCIFLFLNSAPQDLNSKISPWDLFWTEHPTPGIQETSKESEGCDYILEPLLYHRLVAKQPSMQRLQPFGDIWWWL